MLMLRFDNERVSQRLEDAYKFINDDFTMNTRLLMKEVMEKTMILEIDDHLDEMKRRDVRTSRNGFRTRSLLTSCGLIEDIKVPRDRGSTYRPRVFERYKRVHKSVRNSITQMYLHGISTRKVGEVLDALMGERLSAGYVSKVTKELDQLVKEFHSRRIDTSFTYLFLDGLHAKITNAAGRRQRCVVFVAYGVCDRGRRRMIDFRIGRSEGKRAWESFLDELRVRGLKTDKLKLVITDGGKGLIAAVEDVFPFVDHQLCWFHKLSNVAKRLPRKLQQQCIADARRIYVAGTVGRARKVFNWWKQKWMDVAAEAVKCLERDLDRLLAFLSCPKEHHVRIRTTNVIERSFRELRRRLKVMGSFRDTASAQRILCALMTFSNTRWKRKQNHAKWAIMEAEIAA
jgi:putative transposase